MPIAKANNIDIWYETFGKTKDEAVLLVMGACCQGIFWPTEFCEQLAKAGFYVIRYDHRDTGQSTFFDYEEKPYDILELTKDALGLLDYLKINACHVVGLSLGGSIAELMSIHAPLQIASITLIASSCDFRPMNRALGGLSEEKGALPRPKKAYLDWMQKFLTHPPKNEKEELNLRVEGWHILNGNKVAFEEERYQELHQEFITRARHPTSHLNHIQVARVSEATIQEAPYQAKVPTLVVHGTEDPIFPEHGKVLASRIPHSKFVSVAGMGHVPCIHFYDTLILEIERHVGKV